MKWLSSLRLAACLQAIALTAAGAASGRECLHFRNGFSLDVDSHEQRDGVLVAKTGSGTMQFPASEVSEIEVLATVPEAAMPMKEAKPAPMAVEQILREAAVAQGVDAAFMRSVAMVESGMRQSAVSPKGALGLMQLMPGTAKELQVDASRPDANALGGAMYLRKLLLDYRGDSGLALAAYNAGSGAVKKYKGVPPYLETRQYILKVLKEYQRQLKLALVAAPSLSKPGN